MVIVRFELIAIVDYGYLNTFKVFKYQIYTELN